MSLRRFDARLRQLESAQQPVELPPGRRTVMIDCRALFQAAADRTGQLWLRELEPIARSAKERRGLFDADAARERSRHAHAIRMRLHGIASRADQDAAAKELGYEVIRPNAR